MSGLPYKDSLPEMNQNRKSSHVNDIVQDGIAQQISMLEFDDDNAISSEDGIGERAKQALGALRTVESLIPPNTPPTRPFLGHVHNSDTRPLFTEALASEKLVAISTYVQRIHWASVMSDSDGTPVNTICEYLDRIIECLNVLIRRLRGSPNAESNSPTVLHALGDFARSADEWVLDIPESILSFLNEDTLVPSISASSTTLILPSNQRIGEDGICPLERAMITHLGIARKRLYRLEVFTHWARHKTSSSAIHSEIGSLRSAHLLRERGSLHHEYVIISFGGSDGSVPQSWLRAERAAANVKGRWYTPRLESGGLLLGGATLQESISFAGSKEDLRLDDDDELASVIVDNGIVTQSSRSMLLNGLADQFAALANTSQRYRLLSENCRWYARRNILSVAEHMVTAGVLHHTYWLGQLCIVEMLRRRLGDEPFGGRQVEGRMGMLIRIRSLLDHAWSLIVHGNAAEALPLCTEALTMLEGGKSGSHYPPFSISLAWSVHGCALHDLDRLGEALDAHQKACAISRSIRDQELHLFLLSHGALAMTLCKLRRHGEAVNIWRELVDARRRIHRALDNSESTNGLAQSLTNYASVLAELPKRHEHCIRALREAIVLWRRLADQRPDLYQADLQDALSLCAEALDLSGRSAEASAVKREISTLQPVAIRRVMAKGLYGRAKSEAALGNWENALAACKESVEQFRLLFDESPNEYHTHITKALDRLFDYRGLAEPSLTALEACQEAINFYRLQGAQDSQQYFGRLAEWTIDYASLLDALGRTTEAFESSLEAISIARKEFALRPHVFRRNIASCLFNHAIYAAKLERWEEAVAADQESLKHRRHLYKHDPSMYRNKLALGLANLGLHYHGAGQHLEALKRWDEALNLYRILYNSDQDRYRGHLTALLNRMADLIDARGITPAVVPTLKASSPDLLRQEADIVERGAQRKRWGISSFVRKRNNVVAV